MLGSVGTGAARALVGDPIRKSGVPGSQTAADIIEGGAGMVSPGGALKGVKAAQEGRSMIAGERAFRQGEKLGLMTVPTTSKETAKAASDLYAKAAQEGGTLTPDFTNRFIDEVSKIAPQTEKGKILAGDNAVTSALERIEKFRGTPTTLAEAQEIDEILGSKIDKEYGMGGLSKEGKQLLDIQSKFREMIDGAKGSDLEGGKNGFNAMKDARKAWSQTMKLRDLERIQTRAEHSEQPVTAIRQGIKTILANPARRRAFDKDEIAALERASRTGLMQDALRIAGSRLTPMFAAAAGHIPGAVVGHVLSSGARDLATGIQLRKFGDLTRTVGSKVPKPKTDLEALSEGQ